MPHSAKTFDPIISERLSKLNIARCLDVGAGAGKYGKMIKSLYPSCISEAIEISEVYVNRFNLRNVYDTVHMCDAVEFISSNTEVFDVTIMGDVLEHMDKGTALSTLDYISYFSKELFVMYPENWKQDAINDNQFERHRSRWSLEDFTRLNGDIKFYTKENYQRCKNICFIHISFTF